MDFCILLGNHLLNKEKIQKFKVTMNLRYTLKIFVEEQSLIKL